MKYQTAAALWFDLHRVYLAIPLARIMELRRLLQTTTYGRKSCNEYLETIRGIADQLSASDDLILDSGLIRYVLNGLRLNFNSFIVALTTRSDPMTLGDLHGYLLSHEALINSQHLPTQSSTSDPAAFYSLVQSRGRGRGQKGCGRCGPTSGSGPNYNPPLLSTLGYGRSGPTYNSSQGSGRGGSIGYSNFSQGNSTQPQ